MSSRRKLLDLIRNLTDEEAERILPCVIEGGWREENTPCRKVVYAITNTATGKAYIGMTENYDRRIKYHMSRLKNGKHFVEDMQSDFNKYGDFFVTSILEEVTNRKQRRREFELIESHKTYLREIGYNYKDRIFDNWRKAHRKEQ